MWPDIGRDKSADLPRYTISYRAAETDADWGAGRMFAIGLFEQRTAINDIARRLVGSATINHIALQIRSGPTKRYHLPQLRMIVNIHGADSACHVFGIDQNAFHNAVCQCTVPLVGMYIALGEQFKRKDDSQGWFYDEDVHADRTEYDQITVPRIMELRAAMRDSRIAPM